MEPAPGVMLLTLDRPAQRNAIDLALVEALSGAFDALETGARWRAAILTGAPPAFCAGLDLKTFAAADAPRHRVTELICRVPRLTRPIIAAVNGAAFTGGLEIALGCDFILASTTACFADTHLRIGALSGSGMGSRLPHAVGVRFARQMMLGGEPIDAATALRVGLVNEIVEASELLPRAVAVATSIAARDPELVTIVRDVLDRGSHATLRDAVDIEASALADRKARQPVSWALPSG
ncbi:MAG: enoyl-CoA hydratase-related protein [Sphingomonas sp.]